MVYFFPGNVLKLAWNFKKNTFSSIITNWMKIAFNLMNFSWNNILVLLIDLAYQDDANDIWFVWFIKNMRVKKHFNVLIRGY